MGIIQKTSVYLKKSQKFATKRVRKGNISDLSKTIQDISVGKDRTLGSEQEVTNARRNSIPIANRQASYLSIDINSGKEQIRKKIKLISSYGKQPTARRSNELMPRALFNRHNLFGYSGLESFGSIVDRFLGETPKENDNLNAIEKFNLTIENNSNIDSATDNRNHLSESTYYLHSRGNEEGKILENFRRNPTAENIIKYFGQDNPKGNFHAVEYDWADFAVCKNYGKVPNNHMITLRRFPFPVQDNIYDININKYPDIGRLVTWWGEGTNNSLADVMKMEYGFVWKEMESEMQVIKSGPPSQSLTDKLFGTKIGQLARLTSPSNSASNMFQNGQMQGAEFYDFAQHNRMRIDGPVDSIDKMTVRDRGLTFEQKFSLTFEFDLKSIGGVNPRLAMLDMLANILFVTYNRGNFWGGGIRYQSDLRQNSEIAIGDTKLLQQGKYFEYLKSIPTDFQKRFKTMAAGPKDGANAGFANDLSGMLGPLLGGFAKPFANIASGMLGNLTDMFFGKNALASGAFNHMEIPNSLLTNQPIGVWHITVGNPFQPIAVFGNVILEKTSIEFSEDLGWDDFPESMKVVCELKHPIAKDRDAIESVFNVGRGPLYQDPYIFNKQHIDKVISSSGLTAYSPYENNFSTTNDGYTMLKDIAASKFGMSKIIESATNYYKGGENVSPGAKGVLQNQIFGWFTD